MRRQYVILSRAVHEGLCGLSPRLSSCNLHGIFILSFFSGEKFVKLLALSVATVLLLLLIVQSSTLVYAQSAGTSKATNQSQARGKTQKTGSTSKQQ